MHASRNDGPASALDEVYTWPTVFARCINHGRSGVGACIRRMICVSAVDRGHGIRVLYRYSARAF